ncbi:MAG: hypothetical protein AAFR51_15730 [Pseudomonadota bacterium]
MDWYLLVNITIPLFAALVAGFAVTVFERRPKLLVWFLYSGAISLKNVDQPGRIHTHVVSLRNAGKKVATNVRVRHRYLPEFSIYPDVQYSIEDLPEGTKEIVIEAIVPDENLNISYLYPPDKFSNQIHAGIRYDGGYAKEINVVPTQSPKRWHTQVALILMVVGTGTFLYAAWEFIDFIGRLIVAR